MAKPMKTEFCSKGPKEKRRHDWSLFLPMGRWCDIACQEVVTRCRSISKTGEQMYCDGPPRLTRCHQIRNEIDGDNPAHWSLTEQKVATETVEPEGGELVRKNHWSS